MRNLIVTTILTSCFVAQAAMAEPLAFPDISPSLNKNQNPYSVDAGFIGDIHIGGALTGLAFAQTNKVGTDDSSHLDLSNGQVFIQKNTGLVQFYAQAGGYSIPALGTAYLQADDSIDDLYGVLPVAYATLAPHENFSISVGKLPTLIGAEYTFTFQNTNIQRGLLWNQENAVNRGVQLDYAKDNIAIAVAYGDGFYSDKYNWLSGFASYAFDANHSVAFSGGANLGDTSKSTLATPLLQNNQQIYTLGYTYTDENWLISPYMQYTDISKDASVGIANNASTFGGAMLGNYQFNENYGLAARAEYIASSGGSSLLYGAKSDAWSLTITPTYKEGAFFARAEASYVGVVDEVAGAAFGKGGNQSSQARILLETGLLF